MRRLMVALLCLVFCAATSVSAHWVETQGRAEIHHDDLTSARMRALRDAMGQAALLGGARVQAQSQWRDGQLESDYVQMSGLAEVSRVEMLSQERQGNDWVVKIRAWTQGQSSCQFGQTNPYQKSVAVTGFYLQDAQGATLGQLGQVGILAAQDLRRRWARSASIYALDASYTLVYESPETAPVHFDERHRLTNRLNHAAQAMGSQYVVSGVIRDLSTGRQPGPGSRTETWLGQLGQAAPDRARQYVVDLMLHDSYSGGLIYQGSYQVSGDWTLDRFAQASYMSPAFLRTPYGQQVDRIQQQMADDLAKILACQPYMASISRVDGRRITVNQPVPSGIRPGDVLAVYRTSHGFSRSQEPLVSLTDTKVSARVVQVQPGFLIAELPVEAVRLNLQVDDLVTAW